MTFRPNSKEPPIESLTSLLITPHFSDCMLDTQYLRNISYNMNHSHILAPLDLVLFVICARSCASSQYAQTYTERHGRSLKCIQLIAY